MASAAARQLVTDYLAVQQRINSMKTDFQQASKELFQEAAQGLFTTYPLLASFGWKQYTPYFNDGSPCTFSASVDYPSIRFTTSEPEDFDEDFEDEFSFYDYTVGYGDNRKPKPNLTDAQRQELATANAVVAFLSNFTEEQYQLMFGDHVQVKVTSDGIDVDEYEHD